MGQSNSIPGGGISYEDFLAYARAMNIPTEFVDVKATFERYRDVRSNNREGCRTEAKDRFVFNS
jgi:hypothetical protein